MNDKHIIRLNGQGGTVEYLTVTVEELREFAQEELSMTKPDDCTEDEWLQDDVYPEFCNSCLDESFSVYQEVEANEENIKELERALKAMKNALKGGKK